MEQIPPSSPLATFISIDPERMHGVPVFKGTRVPVRALFDHLRAGDSLDVFLDDFEGVKREHAVAAIDAAAKGLLESITKAEGNAGGARAA